MRSQLKLKVTNVTGHCVLIQVSKKVFCYNIMAGELSPGAILLKETSQKCFRIRKVNLFQNLIKATASLDVRKIRKE